jgi:hypothetical protein
MTARRPAIVRFKRGRFLYEAFCDPLYAGEIGDAQLPNLLFDLEPQVVDLGSSSSAFLPAYEPLHCPVVDMRIK